MKEQAFQKLQEAMRRLEEIKRSCGFPVQPDAERVSEEYKKLFVRNRRPILQDGSLIDFTESAKADVSAKHEQGIVE